MSTFYYTIRNYQSADFNSYVMLRQQAGKLWSLGRPVSPQVVTELMARPHYSPGEDLFVIETDGSLIGYMDMTPEENIGRLIIDGWIHPEHCRQELARKLHAYAIRRAGELSAKTIHVNVNENDTAAKTLLSDLGFRCVRCFHELVLDMSGISQQEPDKASIELRRLECGEEKRLTQIQNITFAEHWGYNPNTVESTSYRIRLGDCSPEDVILACDGDKVAGFCWTEVTTTKETPSGKKEGQIFMLGVDPAYRGMSIGRKLLLAGLFHLQSKGVEVGVLTVDCENETAYELYRSVNFKLRSSNLWYEKDVTQDTEAS
jgi:mycothiol synthase